MQQHVEFAAARQVSRKFSRPPFFRTRSRTVRRLGKRDHNLAPDGVKDDGDRQRPAASKSEVMHSVSGGVTRFPITKGEDPRPRDRGSDPITKGDQGQHDSVSQTHTRPMRFRPTTGKRRITRVGRKSHQLVPDEVQEMPKSLPTTGVTRPNNVGRTFTLRRKLGHQRRSAAKTGQDWPPPQRSGGTPTFCYEVPLGAAARSCSGSAEADRGPVRTEHHGTKEEFSPGDFIKPRFSYHEGFQELFPSRTV